MSMQTQDIKRPVHRVPARIAFVLAGIFVVVGLAGAPAFYAFAAFSAFSGLIWALGGGATDPSDSHLGLGPAVPGGLDAKSQYHFGPPK